MENEVRSAIVEKEAEHGVNRLLATVAISICCSRSPTLSIELTINFY